MPRDVPVSRAAESPVDGRGPRSRGCGPPASQAPSSAPGAGPWGSPGAGGARCAALRGSRGTQTPARTPGPRRGDRRRRRRRPGGPETCAHCGAPGRLAPRDSANKNRAPSLRKSLNQLFQRPWRPVALRAPPASPCVRTPRRAPRPLPPGRTPPGASRVLTPPAPCCAHPRSPPPPRVPDRRGVPQSLGAGSPVVTGESGGRPDLRGTTRTSPCPPLTLPFRP